MDKFFIPLATQLADSSFRQLTKFELVYIAVLHGYCCNPEFAKALPESIANLAQETAGFAIESMAEMLPDPETNPQDADPSQQELPFDGFIPDPVQPIGPIRRL